MSNTLKLPSSSQELSDPRLPLARYRLAFRARDPITLPPFQGKLWRGVFGRALKAMSDRAAAESRETVGQLYRNFFEAPSLSDARLRCSKDPPRPYVIAAEANSEPWRFAPGQPFFLELTLIGQSAEAVSLVLETFAHAAAERLGETRGRAELNAVHQLHPNPAAHPHECLSAETRIFSPLAPAESPIVPPVPKVAEIHLVTPLRLMRDNRLIVPETFCAEHLLTSLIQRVSNLVILYAGDNWNPTTGLRSLADRAAIQDPRLEFQDQSRWSARQKAEMPMGGIVGSFTLDMSELAPFWPYFWLGQWVHVGKGAVMGLGALRVREANGF